MKRSRSMTDPDGQRDCGCSNEMFCACKDKYEDKDRLSLEGRADRLFEELPLSGHLDFTAREETRAYILGHLIIVDKIAYNRGLEEKP